MRSHYSLTTTGGQKLHSTIPTLSRINRIECRNLHHPSARCIASPVLLQRRAVPIAASSAPVDSAVASETSTSGRALPQDFQVISSDGKWRVRRINKENLQEVAAVVRMQTDGFHEPNFIPFLDSTFKRFFAAEVLSEMNKKLKYNPDDRFVCLVAEDMTKLKKESSSDGNNNGGVESSSVNAVVGVVEISYIDEKEVLSSLEPGRTGVTYIQSMAVDLSTRRRGAASALLLAAEQVAMEWSEKLAVLHVFQDNTSAVKLYKKQGFEIIFQDAPWLAKLAVRPRFLMRKNFVEN